MNRRGQNRSKKSYSKVPSNHSTKSTNNNRNNRRPETKIVKPETDIKKENIMEKITKTIDECVKLSIDNEKYGFTTTKNVKKLQIGIYVANVRIFKKANPESYKTLMFLVDRDAKTSLIHVTIVDSHPITPTVLFVVSDTYPITKMEKYIPSIVSSTQNMIK
jgi:hypothetical protein